MDNEEDFLAHFTIDEHVVRRESGWRKYGTYRAANAPIPEEERSRYLQPDKERDLSQEDWERFVERLSNG